MHDFCACWYVRPACIALWSSKHFPMHFLNVVEMLSEDRQSDLAMELNTTVIVKRQGSWSSTLYLCANTFLPKQHSCGRSVIRHTGQQHTTTYCHLAGLIKPSQLSYFFVVKLSLHTLSTPSPGSAWTRTSTQKSTAQYMLRPFRSTFLLVSLASRSALSPSFSASRPASLVLLSALFPSLSASLSVPLAALLALSPSCSDLSSALSPHLQ